MAQDGAPETAPQPDQEPVIVQDVEWGMILLGVGVVAVAVGVVLGMRVRMIRNYD